MSATGLEVLGWSVLHLLWQTCVLAMLTWVWLHTPPGRSPQQRHNAAFCALVVGLLLGIVTSCLVAQAATETSRLASVFSARAANAPPVFSADVMARSLGVSRLGRWTPTGDERALDVWLCALAVAWSAAVGLLLARLTGGAWLAMRMRRRANPVRSRGVREIVERLMRRRGVSGSFELLESAEVDSPVVTGIRRPALIVPKALHADLAPELLESVLAHEIEHVRRRDHALAFVLETLCALLIHSPGALWLSRQVRIAREECCDDAATRCSGRRVFVTALDALARLGRMKQGQLMPAAAGYRLVQRMERVLSGERRRPVGRLRRVGMVAAACTFGVAGLVILASSIAHTANGRVVREPRVRGQSAGSSARTYSFPPPSGLVVSAIPPSQRDPETSASAETAAAVRNETAKEHLQRRIDELDASMASLHALMRDACAVGARRGSDSPCARLQLDLRILTAQLAITRRQAVAAGMRD